MFVPPAEGVACRTELLGGGRRVENPHGVAISRGVADI